MINLKILANKTDLYNNKEFLQKTSQKIKYLEGVGFNIAITKDNQFVIFSPVSNNQATIQTITNKNLKELTSLDLLTLNDALSFYQQRGSQNKIFLNLLPATIPIVSEESLEDIKNINKNYVKYLLKSLKPYENLNLYLGSVNSSLMQLLESENIPWKKGIVLFGGNLNYIDVDFYVFGTELLNGEIFSQQLKLNKEVILYLGDANDLLIAYQFFRGETATALANSIFDEILFLNDYPELFLKLFSN